jgi:glycosyltransferase involved in cell wall biosynthesis
MYVLPAVLSILAQEGVKVEFHIADDNSTDGTYEILQGLAANDSRIRLVRPFSARVGPTVLRQWLFDNSDREWVFNQDADDISLPGRLRRLQKLILSDEALVAVSGRSRNLTAEGHIFTYPWEENYVNPLAAGQISPGEALRKQHCMVFGAVALRRKFITGDHKLDADAFPLADWDLFLRLEQLGRIGFVEDFIYLRRIHTEQISRRATERPAALKYVAAKHNLIDFKLADYRNKGNVPGHPEI